MKNLQNNEVIINSIRDETINGMFEKQVKQYPNNIAIKTNEKEITYNQLNKYSNRIARYILNNVNHNNIALLFEHDIQMIIGILSVLKACKTYIPLDSTFPQDRMEYILRDSESLVILTNSQNENIAENLKRRINKDIKTINIDLINETISGKNLSVYADQNSQAYILYTSGSTGNPKGVMQNHRNVLHFIRCYTNNLDICERDKLTLLSTYCFDASVMDIFGALLNGATLYPYNLKQGKNILQLSKWIKSENITIYHSTPTVYRWFIDNLSNCDNVASIRIVVLGGEAAIKSDFESYKKYFSDKCLFVNGLGPTESTVTLQYIINKNTIIKNNSIPVGFSVENTEVYIINEDGKKVGLYEIGEIIYQSDYLALGYWKLPQKTQQVFEINVQTGKRIYKSGDFGRFLSDGSVEYIGRRDSQIKINGYRIELEEIESHINQFEKIKQSVVIALETNETEKILEAFYTSKDNIDAKKIIDYLSTKLPQYMIPSIFKRVKEFFQTPNGKIDRKRVLECAEIKSDDNRQSNSTFNELTNIQKRAFDVIIANLNEKVLDDVSIDTHFASVGLDSITFIKAIIALESEFDFEFDDEMLLITAFSTIKSMVEYVESKITIY